MVTCLVPEVTVTASLMLGYYRFANPFIHLFGKRFTSDRFERLNCVLLAHNALKKLSLYSHAQSEDEFKWQQRSNSK